MRTRNQQGWPPPLGGKSFRTAIRGERKPHSIRYQVPFCMDNKVSISSVKGGCSLKATGTVAAGVWSESSTDIEGEYRDRPCTSVTVMPDNLVAQSNYAVSEGTILKDFARWVSKSQEKILGTAYVGKRIFLRNSRGSRSKDDRRVHKESGTGRTYR